LPENPSLIIAERLSAYFDGAKICVKPEFVRILHRIHGEMHGFRLQTSHSIAANLRQEIIFKELKISTPFAR